MTSRQLSDTVEIMCGSIARPEISIHRLARKDDSEPSVNIRIFMNGDLTNPESCKLKSYLDTFKVFKTMLKLTFDIKY